MKSAHLTPMLTIVVYHYVRDLSCTRYPRIKARRTDEFEAQLDYIQRHYTVIALREVLASVRDGVELPPAPCVLSFDDGLIDHFDTVFPRLLERGLTGVFFPAARPIHERIVLDVHKLHFVLATCTDHEALLGEVLGLIAERRRHHAVPSNEELASGYRKPGAYDPPETAFIKRLLQHGLPLAVRREVVDTLFQRHVAVDERTFSRELYMDLSQLRCLLRAGMEIGGHGDRHEHIGLLSEADQAAELRRTRDFLEQLYGGYITDWVMCYPYGSYSAESLQIAAGLGCSLTLSTRTGLVRLPINVGANPMPVFDRLDTNDLPCRADAPASDWTRFEPRDDIRSSNQRAARA